jgi:serine/threonine-protein kinase RsbW
MKDENAHEADERTPVLSMCGVPAVVDRLAETRRALTGWATSAGMAGNQVRDLALAVYEAMSNVIDHAYRNSSGRFDLRAERHGDHVTVTVADYGRWQADTDPPAAGAGFRGRGIKLMKGLAAEFHLVHKSVGTLVRMRWPLPGT